MAEFKFTFKPKTTISNKPKAIVKKNSKDTKGYIGLDDNLEFYFIEKSGDIKYKIHENSYVFKIRQPRYSINLDKRGKVIIYETNTIEERTKILGCLPFIPGCSVEGKLVETNDNEFQFIMKSSEFNALDNKAMEYFYYYKSRHKEFLNKINGE